MVYIIRGYCNGNSTKTNHTTYAHTQQVSQKLYALNEILSKG
jgi:hypothetical protein